MIDYADIEAASIKELNTMNKPNGENIRHSVPPKKLNRSFPLLRYFTIISLTSLILASLFLGINARKVFVDNLTKSEERNNVTLTQLLANSVWLHFDEFLNSAGKLTGDEIRAHPKTWFLNKYINDQIKDLDVIKIKIYNLDGLTIFSSDFKQIGNSKKSHQSFIQAKKGFVISKLSFRDKIYAKEELIQNRNVIASYVPIKIGSDKKIAGVFEVYKDVTQIIKRINNTQQKVVMGVVGTLTTLFIVLFFVIKNADKIIKDINIEQHDATEKIRQVAFYDSLTGLPNRLLFNDRIDHALQMASRTERLVVLMFIDLDRFKQVNDNLGHEAGDELLRQASARFIECVRTGDTVSRISGDEFTVILENLKNIDFSTTVANRIINKMAKPFSLGSNEVNVTCSIGMSVYPFNDDDADSLVKKSDAAMFFSKSYGRNNYHYYSPDMHKHGSQRYQLETDLSEAIKQSQFFLALQPKVNVSNWTMHGMEALLRWKHPEKGIISPDTFVPILEETGLIIKVGEWVIRESCRITKQWHEDGLLPLSVAVNISALQFRQPGFIDTINSILEDTKLEPQYLELEITESCLIDDAEENIALMHALKNKGIKLTIDDFGTGYSSLNYLCKLPVDTLKIDRSFIHGMMENTQKRSVVTAIISFAHALKLSVVAEGIETKEQLIFINAMRCTAVQGYLLSKPISVEDFYILHKSGGSFKHIMNNSEEF